MKAPSMRNALRVLRQIRCDDYKIRMMAFECYIRWWRSRENGRMEAAEVARYHLTFGGKGINKKTFERIQDALIDAGLIEVSPALFGRSIWAIPRGGANED